MRRSGVWIAVAIAVLSVVAVGAGVAGFWHSIGGAEISAAGWAAMAFGVLASLGLGIGLMALVFFSNRHGYDDIGRDDHE